MIQRPVRDAVARHFAVALSAHQRGDYPAAAAAYRAILARDRGHIDALANLGAALRATGDLTGAIDAYRRALALESDSSGLNRKGDSQGC